MYIKRKRKGKTHIDLRSIVDFYLLGKISLQRIHNLDALVKVAHLGLDERVQMPQVTRLCGTDALEQQLCYLRLPVKVRLGDPQVPLGLQSQEQTIRLY